MSQDGPIFFPNDLPNEKFSKHQKFTILYFMRTIILTAPTRLATFRKLTLKFLENRKQ
jgi:hypothetical protein